MGRVGFIGRKLSTGAPIAKPRPMDDDLVWIVKHYGVQLASSKDKEDQDRALAAELSYLRLTVKRQNDKIRRLAEEIRDTIKILAEALDGKPHGRDFIKREISRLKGALEYEGREDLTARAAPRR